VDHSKFPLIVDTSEDKSIKLGHPSYVWRFGQDRRLDLMRQHVPLEGKRILDVGCGLGMYVRKLLAVSDDVYGVDIDPEKVAEASQQLPHIQLAPAENLPFEAGSFDVVLLHEVIEHVTDDRRAVAEALRVLASGGHALIFVPNRLYPFETHGFYWQGRYHFGNIPLINYLPDGLRSRLAPHVRTYTTADLRSLLSGLPARMEYHTQMYPGYDNLAARRPRLGRALRNATYALERTPLRAFGLSHFVVVAKTT
jgi:SAM-dependent methyltransferase